MAQKLSSFVSYIDIFADDKESPLVNAINSDGSNSNDSNVSEWDLMDRERQFDFTTDASRESSLQPLDNKQDFNSEHSASTVIVAYDDNGCNVAHDVDRGKDVRELSSIFSNGKIAGYLYVYNTGNRNLLRHTRKRWFMYDSNVCKLLFFRSPDDCAPLGEIDISMASFNLDARKPSIFEIRSEGAIHCLEAPSRKAAIEWVKGLQNSRHIYGRKKACQSFRQIFGRSVQQPEGGLIYEEKQREQCNNMQDADPVNILDAPAQVMKEVEDSHDGNVIADTISWKAELKSLFHMKKSKSLSSGLHVSVGSETSDEECKPLEKGTTTIEKLRSFLDLSVFQKSSCTTCQQMQKRLLLCQKEKEGVEDELQALKEVKRVLQRELNIIQKEKETMQYLGCGLHDSDLLTMLQKKDRETVTLASQLNQLEEDYLSVQADKKTMSDRLLKVSTHLSALEESLASRDDQLTTLKYQINDLETENELLKESLQKSRVRRSDTEISELQTLKDLCRGYELQNRVLNQEVMELQRLRIEEERDKGNLLLKCAQLEADKCKVEMKYVRFLQDIQAEGHSSYSQEMVCQLLKDAIESLDEGEDVQQQHRGGQMYDKFGFAIRPWERHSLEINNHAMTLTRRSDASNSPIDELPKEISSNQRWENFLSVAGERPLPRNQELKTLLRLGIPSQFKERVWKACVGFHTSHIPEKLEQGYYAKLLQSVNRNSLDPISKQIELDLLRTLPHNRFYESVDSPGIAKLRNILLAYSMRNASLGYCQGLNRLAAIALLFLNEEDAFWCLVAIIERLMPGGYYKPSLIDAHVDQRVLKDLLLIKLPRLHAHLETHSIDLSMFTFGWFLTVFVDEAPVPMYLRIWDAFLFEGNKVLFRFALAFLKDAESDLLGLQDSLSIHCHLRLIGQRITSVSRIAEIAFQGMNPFPMKIILQKRQIYRAQVMEELQKLTLLRTQAAAASIASPVTDSNAMLSDED